MGPGIKIDPAQFVGGTEEAEPMDRAAKATAIRRESKGAFDKMTSAVFLDYKGMTVESVTKLRAEFRKAGVEYKVVKNTLVRQALTGTAYGARARRRAHRHDRHCVELRGSVGGREGRQGLPQGR